MSALSHPNDPLAAASASGGSPAGGAPAPVPDPSPSAAGLTRSSLHARRDQLAEQVLELQWDLGGLAYEMAIRDHFRLDVLVRRAALLQEHDAELAEIERLLRLEESASAGVCPTCGAPHSRGALFCWQCGTTLMARAPSSAAPAVGLDGGGEAAGATEMGREDTLVIEPAPR